MAAAARKIEVVAGAAVGPSAGTTCASCGAASSPTVPTGHARATAAATAATDCRGAGAAGTGDRDGAATTAAAGRTSATTPIPAAGRLGKRGLSYKTARDE